MNSWGQRCGAILATVVVAGGLSTAGVSAAASRPSTPAPKPATTPSPKPATTPAPRRRKPVYRVAVAIPGPVRAGRIYDVVLSGVASTRATAYLFVDYAGCAATLAGERRRAPGASERYGVSGAFSEVTGWSSSSTGTDHACGYLVDGGGHLLATVRRTYRIG